MSIYFNENFDDDVKFYININTIIDNCWPYHSYPNVLK